MEHTMLYIASAQIYVCTTVRVRVVGYDIRT